MMLRRTSVCSAVVFLIVVAAGAARLSLADTQVRFLRSSANGVEYKLYISVPHEYAVSKTAYPVLYMLDADYSFPVVRAMVQHLSDRNRLPKIILVGIAYGGPDRYKLNRTRDYTPFFVPEGGYGAEYQKASGGAPKFLAFIRGELIPWVDRHYRTVPGDRGLIGHSFGGLFAAWTLITAPTTFNHYVIVSPSLWYDNRTLFDVESKARKARPEMPPAKVYMAIGSREINAERDMVHDLEAMAGDITGWKGLDVKSDVLPDETHDSVFPTAASRGIRFTFGGD